MKKLSIKFIIAVLSLSFSTANAAGLGTPTKIVPLAKSGSLSTRAAQGGIHGGGGVGFSCKQSDGPNKIYLADTYALLEKLNVTGESEPVNVVAAAARLLDTMKPKKIIDHPFVKNEKVTLGWMINYRYKQLKFEPNFSGKIKIPNLNDDHIDTRSVPKGCTKVQLAVQNIATMTVEQSPLINQLSWIERGYLELHETLISLRGEPGADTTPIRKEVEAVANDLESSKSNLSQNILELVPVEICYHKKSKIDFLLASIKEPGRSASYRSIEKMCTSMFDVGNELYVVGIMAVGVGWGSPAASAETKTCVEKIQANFQAKTETLYSFQKRCQEVVNNHPISIYGENSTWVDKYGMGASMLGFKSKSYTPTEEEMDAITREKDEALSERLAAVKTSHKAQLKRTFVASANITTSPTLMGDGTVVTTDDAGTVYFIPPKGKVLSFKTKDTYHKPTLLGSDTVVLAGWEGDVYFLSSKGERLSSFQTPMVEGGFFNPGVKHHDEITSDPVVSPDGKFIVIAAEKAVYYLDRNAKLIGQFNRPGKVSSGTFNTPAISKQGTVVTAAGDTVYFLNSTGKLENTFQCDSPLTQNKCIYGEPAILNDGGVAIAASDASDGLYILNADGSFRARSGSEVSPRTSNKLLVLKDGTIVVISNGSLLLVNSDGSLRSEFSFPHGSPDNSKPAVMNDGTIVIGSDKNIFFLNPDGPLKAIYQIRSEGYGNRSEVAIQNNGMVILETGGKSLEFILLTPNK